MKLGTENRTTTILAIVLMVAAAFLIIRMFSGSGQPAAQASAPQPSAPAPLPAPVRGRRIIRGTRPSAHSQQAENSLDPRLRLDLLKLSEDTEYKGAGRNIFRAEAEIPQPVAPALVKNNNPQPAPVPQPPPGPPPPPPINLKFFGFASGTGEQTSVFLGNGDDVFVAREGEVVNRRYKVVKIHPTSVEIEDLLSNNRQTIPLTAG
jgi:hypothetical protein